MDLFQEHHVGMDVVVHFEQGADYFVDPFDTHNPFSADLYEDTMGALATWQYCKNNPNAVWWLLQTNTELDIRKGFSIVEAEELFGKQVHERAPNGWVDRATNLKFKPGDREKTMEDFKKSLDSEGKRAAYFDECAMFVVRWGILSGEHVNLPFSNWFRICARLGREPALEPKMMFARHDVGRSWHFERLAGAVLNLKTSAEWLEKVMSMRSAQRHQGHDVLPDMDSWYYDVLPDMDSWWINASEHEGISPMHKKIKMMSLQGAAAVANHVFENSPGFHLWKKACAWTVMLPRRLGDGHRQGWAWSIRPILRLRPWATVSLRSCWLVKDALGSLARRQKGSTSSASSEAHQPVKCSGANTSFARCP